MANELTFKVMALCEKDGEPQDYPLDECSIHKLPLVGDETLSVVLNPVNRKTMEFLIHRGWQN